MHVVSHRGIRTRRETGTAISAKYIKPKWLLSTSNRVKTARIPKHNAVEGRRLRWNIQPLFLVLDHTLRTFLELNILDNKNHGPKMTMIVKRDCRAETRPCLRNKGGSKS